MRTYRHRFFLYFLNECIRAVGKLNGHFSLVLGGEAQRGNGAGGGLFEIFDELAGRND